MGNDETSQRQNSSSCELVTVLIDFPPLHCYRSRGALLVLLFLFFLIVYSYGEVGGYLSPLNKRHCFTLLYSFSCTCFSCYLPLAHSLPYYPPIGPHKWRFARLWCDFDIVYLFSLFILISFFLPLLVPGPYREPLFWLRFSRRFEDGYRKLTALCSFLIPLLLSFSRLFY